MSAFGLIGTVVRLQVQRASLKRGERPVRWYDPAPLLAVARITLDQGGVTGWTAEGERVADVHHRDHPETRYRGMNGVSIGFTGHYAAMRARFGDRLVDGIAGETLLVGTDEPRVFAESDFMGGLLVETLDGGRVRLTAVQVADPCVEFTRFALGVPPETPSRGAVAEALAFLGGGTRGFYAAIEGEPEQIGVGARVWVAG